MAASVRAPHHGWLIAGTPRWRPYPCRCVLGQQCRSRCDCAGRTDTDVMPAHCCARRKAETTARRAEQNINNPAEGTPA